jgi:NAD(P)-dependent dehydrogenase (short-subunit alcohol dehydrogenase family)
LAEGIIKPVAQEAVYPSLAGKRVIISGGATGIGEAIVEAFARQGAAVAFVDIQDKPGKALVARLADAAIPPLFIHCDIRNCANYGGKVATIVDQLGGCDVLINNAANDDRHKVDEVTPAYWDERMAVNLKHQFFCAKAVVPGMRRNGGGAIVNLGSISWHLALPELVLYQTCKAAIEGMTRSLARDLGPDNIRVSCVVPGNIRTPRQMQWYTPEGEAEIVEAQCLKGRLVPEDVAALVLFLASADARLITGHEYFVDAGWR